MTLSLKTQGRLLSVVAAMFFTCLLAATIIMGGLTTAAPAHADTFGNKVYVSSGSNGNVRVYGDVRFQGSNLQYYVKRAYIWLAPSQNSWSTGRMIDAKSYLAPAGCTTYQVTGTLTKKYTLKRAGYTHLVSQTFGVHTTLWITCR